MKLETQIDPTIREAIIEQHASDNDRALYSMVQGRDFATIIPIHTSNMKIIVSEKPKNIAICRVIIPEMAIYIDKTGMQKGLISRDHVGYKVAYNKSAFPLAHVFDDTGWLCLGNIFVPSQIPVHSPQQPLETLFLHNDRNINHGHPHIDISAENRAAIEKILRTVYDEKTIFPFNIHDQSWVAHDTLWRIGNYLLETQTKQDAYTIMESIFMLVFSKKHVQEGVKND